MNSISSLVDGEYGLQDLLAGVNLDQLGHALAALMGAPVRLLAANGAALWGEAGASGGTKVPVILEIEPVGYLQSAVAAPDKLQAAAWLLTQVLRDRVRYKAAAEMHLQVVQADYDALKAEHLAVQESEARYRQLSAELEQRVQSQVALLEERRRQLYQVEKLASIGQLAAGVAHEINNPIGFVRSNLATTQSYLAKLRQLQSLVAKGQLQGLPQAWQQLDLDFILNDLDDLLQESLGGVDRVAHIVRDLKGFSSVDRPEEEATDLNTNLREACSVVAGQLPRGVRLVQELHPLPSLMCLPGHLNQVFLNLLVNALKAVGDHGEIVVRSEAAAGSIHISIRDNGCGIPPEQLARVFEPFFTTREVGQGIGLGLTVARDIVAAHGGEIGIDSRVGTGTTVTITLPL